MNATMNEHQKRYLACLRGNGGADAWQRLLAGLRADPGASCALHDWQLSDSYREVAHVLANALQSAAQADIQ